MTNHPHVKKIVKWYQDVGPNCHERLDEIFAENFEFEDPFLKTSRWEDLTRYYSGMFKKYKNPHFVIHESFCEGNMATIIWTFKFQKLGMKQEVHGSWLLKLNDQGYIVSHKDYWDFSSQVLEKIPLIGLIVWFFSLLVKKS